MKRNWRVYFTSYLYTNFPGTVAYDMKVLGVNAGIGPSVVLIDDGEIILGLEEERLTREKNTMGFPEMALAFLEQKHAAFLGDCHVVSFANLTASVFTKAQFHAKYHQKIKRRGPVKRFRDWFWTVRHNAAKAGKDEGFSLGHKTDFYARLKSLCPSLAASIDGLSFLKHHDCHAAAAYYAFAKDKETKYLVLTLDGGGDAECSTVQIGHDGKLQRLAATKSGNSIGNIYSITTFLLGLTPHEHEYKLMGLAAYVPKHYRDQAADIFRKYVTISAENPLCFATGNGISTNWAHQPLDADLHRQRFDNVAGGLQQYTEDLVMSWVRNCITETGIHDVMLSGGVFMNVSMNKRIAEMEEVNSLAIFPSCGDETNAFGAAFYAYMEHTGQFPNFGPFTLGGIPYNDTGFIQRFATRCTFEKVQSGAAAAAELLKEGKVIARCAGDMEFGARALGNRSVLADPVVPNVVERINSTIKQRDFWMPFAPAVLAEDLDEYVVVPQSLKHRDNPSPYMMCVMDSRPERQAAMVAALHRFDKSARVQVVDKVIAPGFHQVISEFKKLTGRSCILNTSFNTHGHPIVRTIDEAIDILLTSTLDAVVTDDYVIKRKAE